MAQGTFSTQVALPQNTRQTRTERLVQQGKDTRYNELKAEAERLKREVFIDKPIETTERYRRKGKWRTRTVQSVDPFTLEEYQQEYSKLSPDLKQFFTPPTEVQALQEQRKSVERQTVNQTISTWQNKTEERKQKLQRYEAWWDRQTAEYKEKNRQRYKDEKRQIRDDIEEYENKIRELKKKSGKIDEGYSANELIGIAEDKAGYLRDKSTAKYEAKKGFESQFSRTPTYTLTTGEMAQNLENLKLSPATVTYEEYKQKAKSYNEDVAYKQKLQTKAKSVGFENLTPNEQKKLNPSAVEWQTQNPDEKLIYNSEGNVIGIKSKLLEGEYSLEGYNAEMQRRKTEYEKQKENEKSAEKYLDEKGFAQNINLTPPKQNIFSKALTGIKALYVSSPFGSTYGGFSEGIAEEVKEERYSNLRQGALANVITGTQIDARKLFVQVPLSKSWEFLQEQRGLNYKQKKGEELFKQLETQAGSVSEELKPYVEAEGLEKIGEAGIGIGLDIKKDEKGNEYRILNVTDQAFSRKTSESLLEYEEARKSGNVVAGVLTAEKVYFSKLLETTMLFGAIGKGIQIVGKGASALGVGKLAKYIPNILKYKTITLQEGSAVVPRNYAGIGTIAGWGLTGLYGYSKYQQYQTYKQISPYGKEYFAFETGGEIAGIDISTGASRRAYETYRKYKSRLTDVFKVKTIPQADLSMEGFYRYNKLKQGYEKVYMERYQGLKLSKPKTWLQKLQGYRKGQFIRRVDKNVSDEVMAYYMYGGNVSILDKTGKLKKTITFNKGESFRGIYSDIQFQTTTYNAPVRTIRAEAFPYDVKATHYDWFIRKNVLEYGVRKPSGLPISSKGKGFGYSATSSEWIGTEFPPATIQYNNAGKTALLQTKGQIQYFSGKGVSVGFLRIFDKGAYGEIGKIASDPVIYAGYFNNVKVNPAIKEIKGIDVATGRELKAYLYSQDTGQAGTLNIPLYKREVEGTVEVVKRVPIRRAYAVKLAGWKVPIQEEVFTPVSEISPSNLKNILKEMGKIEELTGTAVSSLPSTLSRNYGYFTIPSTPSSPSRTPKSSVPYSKISDFSKISFISSGSSSEVSNVSKISGGSSSASSPPSSSIIEDIISRTSYSSSRDRSRISKVSSLLGNQQLKNILKRRRTRRTPEIEALFPDFTARALGIAPKEVMGVEGALKEIKKIQTGFEIRTGARIKGMDEKALLRKVMG